MEVITEKLLRQLLYSKSIEPNSTYEISVDAKVTPSALAFAREKAVHLSRTPKTSILANMSQSVSPMGTESKLQALKKIYQIYLSIQEIKNYFELEVFDDLTITINLLYKYILNGDQITFTEVITHEENNFTIEDLSYELNEERAQLSLLLIELWDLHTLLLTANNKVPYIQSMINFVQKQLQKVGEDKNE